jgi:hypothetical protein
MDEEVALRRYPRALFGLLLAARVLSTLAALPYLFWLLPAPPGAKPPLPALVLSGCRTAPRAS